MISDNITFIVVGNFTETAEVAPTYSFFGFAALFIILVGAIVLGTGIFLGVRKYVRRNIAKG